MHVELGLTSAVSGYLLNSAGILDGSDDASSSSTSLSSTSVTSAFGTSADSLARHIARMVAVGL